MKKLLFAIPLIAGAAWGGTSYYTGTQTQSAYDRLLVQLNEMKPFTLVNESYSAGLMNSTAITQVMASAAPDAKVLFRLHHAIDHSPLGVNEGYVRVGAANIKTTLIKDESWSESWKGFISGFGDAEPFQINTQVGFGGDSENQLIVNPYKYLIDGVVVRFAGLDYNATVEGDSINGVGTIGDLVVDGEGNILQLTAGDIKTDLTRVSQAIYTGDYSLDFDKLRFSSSTGTSPEIAFEQIGLSSGSTLDDDQLSSRVNLSVGNIDSPLPLDNASIDMGLANLSMVGIKQYMEVINQMSVTESLLGSDPEVMKELLKAYLPVIGPGTGVDYTMKFGNSGGQAKLDYSISVIEASAPNYPAAGLDSLETLRDVLNVLRFEAHLDADAEAIDQTPLAMFMMSSPDAQQVIVADGVSYKADITVADLIIDINGNPLSLEAVLGEFLDLPVSEAMSAMDR